MLDMEPELEELKTSKLSLNKYFNDEFYSDVTIYVENKPLYMQKSILGNSSPNFKGMFTHFAEAKKEELKIECTLSLLFFLL